MYTFIIIILNCIPETHTYTQYIYIIHIIIIHHIMYNFNVLYY